MSTPTSRFNRVQYNISLHIGAGRWSYCVSVYPLCWDLRYQHFDVINAGGDTKMVTLHFGPLMMSVTHEVDPPDWRTVLKKVDAPEPERGRSLIPTREAHQ